MRLPQHCRALLLSAHQSVSRYVLPIDIRIVEAGLPKGLLSSKLGGRPHLPMQIRMPHTTNIRPVGEDAVELDFLAVDPLLGTLMYKVHQKGG